MILSDVAKILAYCSSLDKRHAGEAEARAWYEVLPDSLTYEKAHEAVRLYYQQNTTPIMPAQVIQYAKTVGGTVGHYGEPGEILCPKCRGVHYPHEDCSVLITMQQYGVERFWDEVDKRRAELGYGPLDTRRRRRMAKAVGLAVPEREPVVEPVPMPSPQEIREAREEAAMPQAFRDAVEERTGIDPGELFKLPEDVEDLSGF